MDENRYQIVFTGKLVDGHKPRQVLNALAKLFKKTPQEIKASFKGGAVIIRNLPQGKVDRTLRALHRAGAVCAVQSMTAQAPAAETVEHAASPDKHPPVEHRSTTEPASDDMTRPGNIRTIEVHEGDTSLALAPINCNHLSGHDNGVVTSRMDRRFIPFAQIVLAAVYVTDESSKDYQLLLYSTGHKRPLLIHASQIKYNDFPEVSGPNLRQSLRNFINFLAEQCPDFSIDHATEAFLSKNRQPVYANDPLLLACALYNGYSQLSENLSKPPPVNLLPANKTPNSVNIEQGSNLDKIKTLSTLDMLGHWANRWQRPILIAALLGYCLPLLKQKSLDESYVLIWPWHYFGINLNDETQAALGSSAQGDLLCLFSLMPLLCLLGALAGYRLMPRQYLWLPLLVIGSLTLLSSFLLFTGEAERLGIIHLPNNWQDGTILLTAILSIILLAAINHLYRQNIENWWQRIVNAVSGMILLGATALAFWSVLWNNWALHLLYLAFAGLSLVAIKNAVQRVPDDISIELVGQLLRIVLIWTPIAGVISQFDFDSMHVTFVVDDNTELVSLVVNSVKTYATYYAMALSLAVGATCGLTIFAQKKPSD